MTTSKTVKPPAAGRRVERLVHTPGPWTAKVSHDPLVCDARGDCIAIVDSRGALASGEEMWANAVLMAAAPELLAACEDYLYGRKRSRECEEEMRAAIRKARG